MIKIYHAPRTRGFRLIWTCEELGVPYNVEHVPFTPEFRFSDEFLRKSPLGKLPFMEDGEMGMFESCAMVQYVLDKYGQGRLQPAKNSSEYPEFLQWCWFGEATFARPLGEMVNHRRAFPDGVIQEVLDEMKGRAEAALTPIENTLGDREFLLGDTFSAADINVAYAVMLADKVAKIELPANTRRWWDALQQRPAYKAAAAADKKPE